ncbi:OmpA family protein [Rhodobacteraceae bacterium F11138]|nr:OmpA family protein [Rhodobacteraceae bacterium F11138]
MVRLSKFIAISLVAGLGLAAPSALLAQDASTMSAEEIADAFKKQKTRGLVIVPTTQDASTADTANSTSVAPTAAMEYTAVNPEDQVNIQIAFDFDSAALREDQKVKLATLCNVMKSVDVSVFQIVGHTDSAGSAAYNERLSLLRAEEVKHHLANDCGIPENRLQAIGMGESAPLDDANPRADSNRRVEFQALG